MADTDVATRERRDIVVKTFELDMMETLWQEYLLRKDQVKENEEWIEEFRRKLETLADGAQQFLLRGKIVATHEPVDKMQTGQLRKENPALYDEYVELVTERKFDEERFRKENPGLWAQYQSRSFRVK